jgi:hypothetical protein
MEDGMKHIKDHLAASERKWIEIRNLIAIELGLDPAEGARITEEVTAVFENWFTQGGCYQTPRRPHRCRSCSASLPTSSIEPMLAPESRPARWRDDDENF